MPFRAANFAATDQFFRYQFDGFPVVPQQIFVRGHFDEVKDGELFDIVCTTAEAK